ncbi:hypothetical protein [Serratia fonticola]|uniref:hypothetical protein n=1 Tax=Serratia fonticola TaxID=47917 RepID=UPI001C480238|nr:hypothetical protein [Serratia fonticola]QXN65242.1 hypothetical protein J8M99_26130 [Serratia fonticola]
MIILLLLGSVALSFLLLGWKMGGALIVSVFSVQFFSALAMLIMDIQSPAIVFDIVARYLQYYIYAMWLLGFIWRLATCKQILSEFKSRRLERKQLNKVISKYQKS